MPGSPDPAIESADVVTFGVLGPLRAENAHGPLALKGPRHRALLARLLIAHGRVVPVSQLVGDLWERPPRDPTGTIQTFVSDLRRVLEPERPPRAPARLLVTSAPGYALRTTDGQVDADRFAALTRAAAANAPADPAAALSDLETALGLWRGPAYAELADRSWARAEIVRLGEARSQAVELRARALSDLGRQTEAVLALEAHLHEHPLREPAWHTVALAHYRSGRQADALAALRAVRRDLRDELGVDPGPALRRLEADILAQAPHLDAQASHLTARATQIDAADTYLGDAASVEQHRAAAASVGTAVGGSVLGGASAAQASPGARGIFVGRSDERRRIAETAARIVTTGRAELVLVSGIEGAGKTALAETVSAVLAERGWIVAWGSSPADRGAPPNWPWIRIAARLAAAGYAATVSTTDTASNAETPAEIAGANSGIADPAVERFRARHAAVDQLGMVARNAPVLVVFDDLHWAGEETLELLTALATTPVSGPVLLVATYRGTDVEPGLAAALARLARAEPVRVQLGGLDREAVAELVREVAGPGIDAGALRRIDARGQGNPFYLRELARLWRDEGATALAAVPAGVRDVVRHRVQRLAEPHRAVLEQAAVAGPELDFEVLTALTGDEQLTDVAVTAALRAGFLDESETAGTSFAHALVREVVYGDIPGPRRSAWHARIATLLEATGTADPAVLAHHFGRAATRATAARAGQYARRAASAAERVFAPHEAARLWSDAVTGYRRAGDVRAGLEATMGLVRALAVIGRLPEAGSSRAEAIRSAAELGDPELTARVIVAFDVPTVWTEPDDPELTRTVVAAAERVLREMPTADPELRCRLFTTIALELRATDPARGRAAAESAVALAAHLNNPTLRALTLNARFLNTFDRAGLAPERAALGAELIAVSQAAGLVTFEVLGHLVRIQALSATADFDAADQHAEAADALADRYELPLVPFFTRWYAALRTSITATLQEAEAAYRSASAAHSGTAMPGVQRGLLPLALLCLRLRHGEPIAREDLSDLGAHAPWVRPLVLLDRGDSAAARAALLALPAPPRDLLFELRLCLLARAAVALGEQPLIARLRDQLAPAATELAGAGTGLLTLEPVFYYLALLDRHLT
ncbi:BTAD domain-containing putative transcriptional regulator [Nocardia sp. NPDC004340]